MKSVWMCLRLNLSSVQRKLSCVWQQQSRVHEEGQAEPGLFHGGHEK